MNRIVKFLELNLEVRSEPGKGSRFSVDVPAGTLRQPATIRESEAQLRSGEGAAERPRRILLVEDDADVRNATQLLLRAAGYEVASAASRAEALGLLEVNAEFDLLITDFRLGIDGTGLDVIAAIRERRGVTLPAILLSGDTSMGVQGRKYDSRCRIASKPLQAEQLLALIDELLGR